VQRFEERHFLNSETDMHPKGAWALDIDSSGRKVKGVFCLKKIRIMEHKNRNGFYILMVLSDKSGEVNAVFWNYEQKTQGILNPGDFLYVKGLTVLHNNRVQLRADILTKTEASRVDVSDFIPKSMVSTEGMEEEIRQLVDSLEDEYHRAAALAFFDDPVFMRRFRIAPAAMNWHHSYAGGLMEHSLNVARICDFVRTMYPLAVRDTLIVGALLHDIGKIEELSSGPAFDYTDSGKLLGHISIGFSMFEKAAARIDNFPDELKNKISHIILSHHGIPDFGSPKRPKTIEAMIVRCADDLDAQTAGFSKILNEGISGDMKWSDTVGILQRPIFLK
jgi:3'-5' exoribonuclease